MEGMKLRHPDGTRGVVTATSVQPDGMALARINDRWLPAAELTA